MCVMKRIIVEITLLLTCFSVGLAQPLPGAAKDNTLPESPVVIQISFPVGGTSVLPEFCDNAASLDKLQTVMDTRDHAAGDIIRVVGKASLEESESRNIVLARRRAESIRNYIVARWPVFADAVFITVEGEAWTDFRDAVAADPDLSDDARRDVLDIIDSHATADRKEAALRALPAWRHIYRDLFPDQRAATVSLDFALDRLAPELVIPDLHWDGAVETIEMRPDRLEVPVLTRETRGLRRKTVLAVKSNLLYDAATMINYAIEVPVGNRFSLVWEHYFPWWVMNDNRICVQYLTLGGEARWWFLPQPRAATEKREARDRLVGHYVGVYGFWGKADLQWDRTGCYQCDNIFSAGLTYGYVFPISRHLNLELSASVGYARIPFQHYIPSTDWQTLYRDRDDEGVTHYFGPTKIQVSLVWPLQFNTRAKEGARK